MRRPLQEVDNEKWKNEERKGSGEVLDCKPCNLKGNTGRMKNFFKSLKESHRHDVIAIGILVVLVMIFFFDPLFTGKAYYLDDVEAHHYFLRSFQHDMGKAGKLFLWNPYSFAGQPYLADNQNALFYPVNWLYFFVAPARGIVYFTVIQFFLAGLFSYIFLRGKKLSSVAALSGAIFYAFSGFMVFQVLHLHFMAAITLIPLILYMADIFIREKTFFHALLLGFIMGIHLLCGTYQYSQLMYFIVFIYIGVNLNFKKLISGENLRLAGLFALSVVFSVVLSSAQLFPTYEFLNHSNRLGGVPFADAAGGSMGMKEIMMMLVPDYLGNPISPQGYKGDFYYWEICFYIGIFPLILAVISPFIAAKEHKKTMTAMGFMVVLGLLLGAGKFLPVFGFFYRFVPFFNAARIPSRYLAALLPAIMFFIAVSTDSLIKIISGEEISDEQKRRRLLIAAGSVFLIPAVSLLIFPPFAYLGTIMFLVTGISGITLVYLAVSGKMRNGRKIFQPAVILLLVISAFSFGFTWNPTVECSYYPARTQFLAPIQDKTPPVRIYYFPPFELLGTLNLTGTRHVSNISGFNSYSLQDYIAYILYSEFGLELTPEINRKFINNANRFSLNNLQSPMMKLLNMTYYYEYKGKYPAYSFSVKEVEDPYPRAFICHNFKVMKERKEILEVLRSGEINLMETLLLEENPGFNAEPEAGGRKSGEEVKFLAFNPDYIRMLVKTDRPGLLFLSEIYYPGWKAKVNEVDTKILRADYMFRAIPVQSGEQLVELYFDPDSFKRGVMVSIGALLLLLGAAICRRRKR